MESIGLDAKNQEARRLWRAWRTVHEMLQDRGYELSEEEINISLDDFLQDYTDPTTGAADRSKMRFSARPSDNMIKQLTPPATESNPDPAPACGPIWVEFMKEEQVGVGEIKKFINYVSDNAFRDGIMVTQGSLSSQARKVINAAMSYNTIECFMQDDLLVNITHHELVPKHILLSRAEKTALLERYRLKETQLPRILAKDPVARYLGLRRGDVVKIIRTSETAGRYASYRLCV